MHIVAVKKIFARGYPCSPTFN